MLPLQKWTDDATAWESLATSAQEQMIGRRKADSVELDDEPADSHVASTDQDRFGKIFRPNMPYGTVTADGTMFVGFCREQRPLAEMLEHGRAEGWRSRCAHPLHPSGHGRYYFVPAADALLAR